MNFSVWLAFRHLAKARRGGFLGRVSLLAFLGVALSVATLLTVFAFVQGFQRELRLLLTGMNPAIFVSSMERGQLTEPMVAQALLGTEAGVTAAAPFIQQKGVLSLSRGRDLRLRGVILRGVDPVAEREVTRILDGADPPMSSFTLPGAEPGILLGSRLAEELGVLPGEELTFTTVLQADAQEVLHYPFMVLGFVESGLYEFDRLFAYVDLEAARQRFRPAGGVDGLGLRLDDIMAADQVAASLRQEFRYPHYQVASWMDLNGDIFQWMRTMRTVLFLALCLIMLVAGFNIAASMTIIVTEKTREIGLLLALGASRRGILAVFLLEGWIIGLAGVLAGGLLGLAAIAYFKDHPLQLPGEIYFIDHMPTSVSPSLLLAIAGAAILVAFLALILPGLEALRRTPMDALRSGGGVRA